MNRLTDNDKNFGHLTIAKWYGTFAVYLNGGNDEDPETYLLITGFHRAARLQLPFRLKTFGKYNEHSRRYGISLSDMGNGYDFLQIFYGPQTHDSSTTKSWCKHLPWKQWDCVRNSLYYPTGEHYYTKKKGSDFREFLDARDKCPKKHYLFLDYDNKQIIASCTVEEREWRKGSGWFKWLRLFYKPKIVRSLDLRFRSEVGPEKGSWKGGTIGHGIDMLSGETPEQAFRRYCDKEHKQRGKSYKLQFVGLVPHANALIATQ